MTHEPPEKRRPLILEIKGNSLDDGPGIRTVVFFKGCPLSCIWCHNPESKKTGPELSFDPRECVGCDSCIGVCPLGALDRANARFIDREKCDLCYECVEACPSGALSRVGRYLEPDEVVAEVEKDLPFFRTSGGGVTFSGGEPTLYMDYASDLLSRLKEIGVHTLIETCGLFDWEQFGAKMLPLLDTVYFDLKIADPDKHKAHCGASNDVILENFRRLCDVCADGGPELLPRIPLIPGSTSDEENLKSIAGILEQNGMGRLAVLQYNPLWVEKSGKIGAPAPPLGGTGWTKWMERAELERCRSYFDDFELA
jgi:pyruvate formate lyase activating enzyme